MEPRGFLWSLLPDESPWSSPPLINDDDTATFRMSDCGLLKLTVS